MNWLHGTPMTVNPRSAYSSCNLSSPAYCGVSPHRLATLTTRAGRPPLRAPRVVGTPSRVVTGRSRRSLMAPPASGPPFSFRLPLQPAAAAVPVLLRADLAGADAERGELRLLAQAPLQLG